MNSNANALVFKSKAFDVVDQNGQPWLKLGDIAAVLYAKSDEQRGSQIATPFESRVRDLYRRHADEFSANMTAVVEMATAGGKQLVRIFSLRGAHLLAMFARTPVAKEFRAWVLDLLDREFSFAQNRGDVLTADQAEQLRVAMQQHVSKLPKDKQAAFMIQGWSKLKSHFGVPYRKIPQHELTSALSIIARHAAQWELVDETPAIAAPAVSQSNLDALIQHVEFLRSWWTEFEPALRALSPDVAGMIHDHFVHAASLAFNLARAAGIEVDKRIRDYPWRSDSFARRQYMLR